jgi:hypothetical protein
MDHTSILKFIGLNWGLAMLTSRESQANDLVSAFTLTRYTHAEQRSPLGQFFPAPAPIVQCLKSVIAPTSQLGSPLNRRVIPNGT